MSFEQEKLLVNEDGAPIDGVGGFETEYFYGCNLPGQSLDIDDKRGLAIKVIREVFNGRADRYEEDGDRCYVDVGDHPELSIAEDSDFLGSSHRLLHGHKKMADYYRTAAEKVSERYSDVMGKEVVVRVDLVANTCDSYGNSWGSHSNILAPRQLNFYDYANAMLVHNASRIVWSGSGHVQLNSAGGFEFHISEKARHIWEEIGHGTTQSRPLVNTRDVPYADAEKYRRIHDISGDSVISPHVNTLRRASSAIILRACALPVTFDDLLPTNSVSAIKTISEDPTLRTKIDLSHGGQLTGLEIQTKLAERVVGATMSAGCLTDQEQIWGEKWLQILEDLATDPLVCIDRVDWIIKQRLIERAVGTTKTKDSSKGALALQHAVEFHRLLPHEGTGMRLLRKGHYADSPQSDILDNGLELPETRAKLRGNAIRRLRKTDRDFSADWVHLKLHDTVNGTIILKEPLETTNERLEEYLQRNAA